MELDIIIELGLIIVLGVGAQWLARLLGFPSIIVLLVVGILAGPITGVLDPDALFGDLLDPAVSLAVGLILFDAGFSLDFSEIREGRRIVVRLTTLGLVITWVLTALVAVWLLDLDTHVAVLLGAILVVSGPTVVTPLLRESRVREPTNAVLRWEGIIDDPVGATVGVAAFHVIASDTTYVLGDAGGLLLTAGIGIGIGIGGAALLVAALRFYKVPDDLQVPVALLFAVGVFIAAEAVFSEAGLFATTALGVALRNQRLAVVTQVRRFQQDLASIILGTLFVVLAARVALSELRGVLAGALALTAAIVLVIRPAAVFVSTIRTKLGWRDKAFVASLAPKGIVAASTSAVYAQALERQGVDGASAVQTATFVVIVAAGIVYGLTAKWTARFFGVAKAPPKGIAIVAEERWGRTLAEEIHSLGASVLLVATDREDLLADPGIPYPVFAGQLDSHDFSVALEKYDVGSALVASPSAEHNLVAMGRLSDALGRTNVFHLPPETGHYDGAVGRLWAGTPDAHKAFDPSMTREELRRRLGEEDVLVLFDLESGEWVAPGLEVSFADTTPLFTLGKDGSVRVVTQGALNRLSKHPERAETGTRMLALVSEGSRAGDPVPDEGNRDS